MARVNWRTVFRIMKAHGWREVDLCRMMGIRQSHFSEVKHGHRPVTMPFVDMLVDVLRIDYNSLLIHQTYEIQPTARERLKILALEDGRPWPVQPVPERPEATTAFQRHLHDKQLQADLDHF